jgi:hypothetical protein
VTTLEYPPVAHTVARRCRFDLTFRRADRPRPIWPGYLGSDLIDDARRPGRQSCGEWEHLPNSLPDTNRVEDWADHYAAMAIAQSVHEALEWFHLDGQPWLDPHDDRVTADVDALVDELAARLAQLRRKAHT